MMDKMTHNSIPKIIWMYWEQGWDRAPLLVQACKKSWEYYNDDWEVRTLDRKSVREFFNIREWVSEFCDTAKSPRPLKRFFLRNNLLYELIPLARRLVGRDPENLPTPFPSNPWIAGMRHISLNHRSNIIRINLLEKYGGIWADATLFCRKPLESWIEPHTEQGFFAFSKPRSAFGPRWMQKAEGGRVLPSGSVPLFLNYFLISAKNHPLTKMLSQAMREFWQTHRSSGDYFFMVDDFNQCYERYPEFRKIWDKVVKFDALIPDPGTFDESGGIEFFARHSPGDVHDLSDQYKTMLKTTSGPAFKLSHKKEFLSDGLRMRYLFSTIGFHLPSSTIPE